MFKSTEGPLPARRATRQDRDKGPALPQAPPPLFKTTMDQEMTEPALNILGISLGRKEVKSLAESLPLPWKEWWSH
eukprot:8402782-Pyramimonas_sp.AAC.1